MSAADGPAPVPACGPNGRIALIVPPANPVAECEIPDLLPRSIQFHVSRFAPVASDDLLERVRGYDTDVGRAATQFAGMGLDAVVLAFAATSFLRGRAGEEGLLAELRGGRDVPSVTAAEAIVLRADELGRRRITLVSPYPDALDDLALRYWSDAGLEVVEVVNVMPPGGSIYAIHDESVARAVLAERRDPDSLIALCGTGMSTVGQLWRIRKETGLPCTSYNAAIAAWVLRTVGPFA